MRSPRPGCGRRSGNPPGSRPGSRAQHAPPALTFGLPGKQMVKEVQAGCDLMRPQNTLADNPKILPVAHSSHPTGVFALVQRGGRPVPIPAINWQPVRMVTDEARRRAAALREVTAFASVFSPARSERAGSRRTRCPPPAAPWGRARPWSAPAGCWFRDKSVPAPRQ
jgi:hypothetical protein